MSRPRKVAIVSLSVALLVSGVSFVVVQGREVLQEKEVASVESWMECPEVEVPVLGTWTIELPTAITWDGICGAAVVDEMGRYIPAEFRSPDGTSMEVTPVLPYERSTRYSLRLFATDGTFLSKTFTTEPYPTLRFPDPDGLAPAPKPQDQFTYPLNRDLVIEVPAYPELGFNYPYLLFVPYGLDETKEHRLLVESNNSGWPSNDYRFHMGQARDLIRRSKYTCGFPRELADRLRIPLLIPVFPRLYTAYTHALTRDALLIDEEDPAYRVDLQLVAMIRDARNLLAHNGIRIKEKVFINGFSASANFATRFALMHPELVRAVAAGGGTLWTLPLDTYKGRTLRYPVLFIYWGDQDTNDTVTAPDCFHPEDSELILSILGHSMKDRWLETQAIYREAGIAVQFVTYKGVGHWPGNHDDVFNFFRANDNDQEGITSVELEPLDREGN